MKKLIALLLAVVMVLGLVACAGDSNTSSENTDTPANTGASEPAAAGGNIAGNTSEPEGDPESVTVTGQDSNSEAVDVTVPYKPERVVVLDLANLDILDNLGLGDCIVGVPTITLDYLKSYEENADIANVGSVKTPDLEAVMACEPDVIFMGGRMAEYYDDLTEIAPVVRLTTSTDKGLIESIRENAKKIGAIFGEGEQVDALLAQYDARVANLAEIAAGKTCLLGMCTTGSFNLLGNDGRCSIIVNEIGFENVGLEAATNASSERSGRGGNSAEGGESSESGGRGGGRGGSDSSESGSTPTHGNEASFELVVSLNPDYIFVMDRDAAIGTNGAQLAQEVMENELVMKTDAYQNGNLVILEHPGIWYLAEGGITSLGIMLDDLEAALAN